MSGMPRERLEWIKEGLKHADREVRSSANYCGAKFCEECRCGPAELAPHYATLVDNSDAKESRLAISYLGAMGVAGIDRLKTIAEHASAEVRAEVAKELKQAA